MEVYKDSNGNVICRACNTVYTTFAEAMDCAARHKVQANPDADPDADALPADMRAGKAISQYWEAYEGPGGTLEVQKRLVMSIIEDYAISKETDLKEKNRIGAMTLNLGKTASESLAVLNKQIYGEKTSSVSVSLNAQKRTDINALKDLVTVNRITSKSLNSDDSQETGI